MLIVIQRVTCSVKCTQKKKQEKNKNGKIGEKINHKKGSNGELEEQKRSHIQKTNSTMAKVLFHPQLF